MIDNHQRLEELWTRLLQERNHLIGRPAGRAPRVPVGPLRPAVHHHIGRRSSTQHATARHDQPSVGDLRRLAREVKLVRLAIRSEVREEEGWVLNGGHLVVGPGLDHEDGELRVRVREPGGYHAASRSAW